MMFAAAFRDEPSGSGHDLVSDQRLIMRVRESNLTDARAALGNIFSAHAPRLLRYARVQLGTNAAAEDVVQELFLSIWAGRASWTVRGVLSTYLFQAVRNRIINVRRDAVVRARIGATHENARLDVVATPVGPEEILAEQELQRLVDHAIAALPPRAREAYSLVKEAGMSHADAARVMGVTTDAVVGHLRRALQGMRDALAAHRGD
jgi:RNA polymerase sigma-70 factor (ECF subfamily)